jgi:hypothetical protein
MKRKGKHILPLSTKKARGQVVHNLAVQVHELQAEEAVTLESRTDGSSFGSKKYGSIKRIIADAVTVYPWMDRNKVYNGIRAIKKRQDKQVPSEDDVAAAPAQVLQFSTVRNQHHGKDDAEVYVGADLKAIVHQKKWKGDPAVPSLVSKLREPYAETKGRPDLTLLQYLADQGYEGDNVDRNENMRIVEDGAVTV